MKQLGHQFSVPDQSRLQYQNKAAQDPQRCSDQVDAPVDIVIPVYNARELTARCVESVLRHATGIWRLIVINDASTEPGLEQDLDQFARKDPRVLVLKNEINAGFVRTANRGMKEAGGRDVLLLNSDTEVFSGFLDRFRVCAYADATTGVLSPLSNNATICSVPEMGRDNPIPEGFSAESFAELVAAASQRRRPEIVTAVGFCMYVKAQVFERIGYFDEIYGRGFGEENDFCERAKRAGFRIRLCDDVFVLHKGKASFGDEGHSLESTNARLLEAKQPGYHAAVARFIKENPLAPIQEELRFQIKRLGQGRENALLYVPKADAAPKYQTSSWYPAFLKLKSLVPKGIRSLGRKALIRLEERHALKLYPDRETALANLRLIRRRLRYSIYQAVGPDPQIVFTTEPFTPQSVTRIRFRLRHDFPGSAYAQLFWRHSPEEGFSEEKSAKVTLESVPGTWREYAFRLDDPTLKSKWQDDGKEIVQLRFDPMNVPARFEMGPLELLV